MDEELEGFNQLVEGLVDVGLRGAGVDFALELRGDVSRLGGEVGAALGLEKELLLDPLGSSAPHVGEVAACFLGWLRVMAQSSGYSSCCQRSTVGVLSHVSYRFVAFTIQVLNVGRVKLPCITPPTLADKLTAQEELTDYPPLGEMVV